MRILVEDLSSDAVGKIEERMRPGRYSTKGFLGAGEGLADVIARDEQALASLSLTPEQIGDRLESIVGQAFRLATLDSRGVLQLSQGSQDSVFCAEEPGIEVEGRYSVRGIGFMGYQQCPFEDTTGALCPELSYADFDFVVKNASTRQSLTFGGLCMHLIRDHHFFEGSVPHRVDPVRVSAVLDLQPGEVYQPEWATEVIWDGSSGMGCLPDQVDPEEWRLMGEIKQVLDGPEETREICPGAQLHRRGDVCVVVAEGDWSVAPGTMINGAEWTWPNGFRGTWSFKKRVHRYVPVAAAGASRRS